MRRPLSLSLGTGSNRSHGLTRLYLARNRLAEVKGEWHEYESKRARKRQREEGLADGAAPAA